MDSNNVNIDFLTLGSDNLFMECLFKNNHEIETKILELKNKMNETGIDEQEIMKEIEPDTPFNEIKKYLTNAIKSEWDFGTEKAGMIMTGYASDEVNSSLLTS